MSGFRAFSFFSTKPTLTLSFHTIIFSFAYKFQSFFPPSFWWFDFSAILPTKSAWTLHSWHMILCIIHVSMSFSMHHWNHCPCMSFVRWVFGVFIVFPCNFAVLLVLLITYCKLVIYLNWCMFPVSSFSMLLNFVISMHFSNFTCKKTLFSKTTIWCASQNSHDHDLML